MNLHAVVLAAGGSSRFGSPKQLAPYLEQPMLRQIVANALSALGGPVIVVLGAHAAEIVQVVNQPGVSSVVNHEWEEGIASSIRAGVRQLPDTCDGVFVLLGDQPRVSVATLQQMSAAWRRRSDCIVASVYRGTVGAPAIFPRWCFEHLLQLRGEQGARMLLQQYSDKVLGLENPEAEFDVDTPADLVRILRQT